MPGKMPLRVGWIYEISGSNRRTLSFSIRFWAWALAYGATSSGSRKSFVPMREDCSSSRYKPFLELLEPVAIRATSECHPWGLGLTAPASQRNSPGTNCRPGCSAGPSARAMSCLLHDRPKQRSRLRARFRKPCFDRPHRACLGIGAIGDADLTASAILVRFATA
jgi:hypothetical protein